MGKKGAQLTSSTTEACELAVDFLAPWVTVAPRKMFGGYGLFSEGSMIGLVDSSGVLRLRARAEDLEHRLAEGATQHGKMLYFSIPKSVCTRKAAVRSGSRPPEPPQVYEERS